MTKKNGKITSKPGKRPERIKLTAEEECIKRMLSFPARREEFIAAIRKNKGRGVSS